MRSLATLLVGAGLALATLQVDADETWLTSGDSVLSEMRGGFRMPDGLMVSFSIVRTVQVDGVVVSQSALSIPDVGSLTLHQARQLGQQAAGIAVVQNGAGNSVQLPQLATQPGIVIQNSESNRQLQALTEITATANSLRLLQSMNLNQALSNALKGGLGR